MVESSGAHDIAAGEDAHSAYRKIILAQDDVAFIELCRYSTPPPLQSRIEMGPVEREIIDSALSKRADGETPFWSAVFSTCLKNGTCPPEIVRAALLHNGPGSATTISAHELRAKNLSSFFGPEERNVGLSSRLTMTAGSVSHLALLDFRCEVSPANLQVIQEICAGLYEGGFVVIESGHSYHACGFKVVSNDERLDFLAKSLLFSPIVDMPYVSHQLRQPFSTIRMSPGGSSGRLPKIAIVNDGDR